MKNNNKNWRVKIHGLILVGSVLMMVILNSCGSHTCDAYKESDYTKKVEVKKDTVN